MDSSKNMTDSITHASSVSQHIEKCDVMGSVGVMIQFLLASVVLLVLIYKRRIEKPRRVWKVFFLDVTKQFFSMSTTHFLNVLLAVLMSHNSEAGDSCVWYFVTVVIDSSLGTLITCFLLSQTDSLFERFGHLRYKSGNYFTLKTSTYKDHVLGLREDIISVDVDRKAWSVQLAVFLGITVFSKLVIIMIPQKIQDVLQSIGEVFLSWFNFSLAIKLLVVIVIFPSVLTSLQFWVQDNFLKKKEKPINGERNLDSRSTDTSLSHALVHSQVLEVSLPEHNKKSQV